MIITESRLHQNCFMWFHNTFPQYRGLFFRIRNENQNKISGAIGKATGIIPGVADSCLLLPGGEAIFIEFKTETGKQSPIQAAWQSLILRARFEYHIIRSEDEFKNLINGKFTTCNHRN